MADIIYDRQKDIHISLPEKVLVAGCGGTGFWSGLFLAMSGAKHMQLFDPDTIDATNLNRLPIPISTVGQPKVNVLKDIIVSIRPDTIVEVFNVALDPDMLPLLSPSLVVDCSDKFEFQEALYQGCLKRNIRYMRAGYDGTHITVTEEVKDVWKVAEGDGYQTTPSWVVPAVVSAALATYGTLMGVKFSFAGELAKIGQFRGGTKTTGKTPVKKEKAGTRD